MNRARCDPSTDRMAAAAGEDGSGGEHKPKKLKKPKKDKSGKKGVHIKLNGNSKS